MKTRDTVLVIDDDPAIREFLDSALSERFEVITACTGLEGIRLAKASLPDVILLDILMPGDDGLACLQELRAEPETAGLPILMLTALNEADVRIRAFTSGADDFIAKPFDPDELIARIESKIARLKSNTNNVISLILRVGDVVVDLASLRVSVGGLDVNLGPVEFRILALLMRQRGRLTRREELENSVWPKNAPAERGLDSHIFSLRKKLQASNLLVQTVYGMGYTLSLKNEAPRPDVF